MQYAAVNAGASGLNVRIGRSQLWCPFTVLKTGTVVNVVDTVDGWCKINAPVTGWCSGAYLVFNKSPVLSGATTFGIAFGNGAFGEWHNGLSNRVAHLRSATVLDEWKLANELVSICPSVVFRFYGQPNDTPAIPVDSANAAAFADVWMSARWSTFAQLDSKVYIQPICNVAWQLSHAAFFMRVMAFCEARGRKAAIGGYDAAQPNVDQWQHPAFVEMLTHAKQFGHVVALHVYSQAGTPPGNLSADLNDYEKRPLLLMQSVPESARPKLRITEFGNSWARGANVGLDAMKSASLKMLALYAGQTDGIDWWCLDNQSWKDGDISPQVIPLFEAGILG